MNGIREVRSSQTLQRLLAVTLAVGNEMNRTDVKCFALDSLLKLSSIKGESKFTPKEKTKQTFETGLQ